MNDPSPVPRDIPAVIPASQPPPKWFGFLHLTVGTLICLAATGLIPIDEAKLHAPRWVLFAAGLVFVCGGTLVLNYRKPGAVNACASLMVLCLGTVALWAALFGDAAQFSGNLPTSPERQVSIARIAFGLGGAICYAIAAVAVFRALRPR